MPTLSVKGNRVKRVRIRKTPSDDFELLKKMNCNGMLVYSASQPVTYYIDTNVEYTEEVEYGASCLNPTTFTPQKEGWSFRGWRIDPSPSPNVYGKDGIPDKIMGTEPIKLYAVFEQTVYRRFVSYDTTTQSETKTGTRYWNNGQVANPSIVVPTGKRCEGWPWRGWSPVDNELAYPESGVFAEGITLENVASSGTHYGLYKQDIIQTFVHTKTESETVTRYWSASSNTLNPSIKFPTAGGYSGRTFRGWSYPNVVAGDAEVFPDKTLTVTGNNTFYALYQMDAVVTYLGNENTGGSTAKQSKTIFWSASGNYAGNSITLRSCGFTRRSYTFKAWAMGNVAGTQYDAAESVKITGNTTFYALWTANTYAYVMHYNAAWSATAATKNASIPTTEATYWKVKPTEGYITFAKNINVSNLSKIRVVFNDSRNEKIQVQVYLPTSAAGGKTNLVGDTELISTENGAVAKEFDISSLTGTRYITIAVPQATNALTLWQVGYK